ncbi:YkgJ family cysteine cluster protein [Methanolobus sp. WCC5]|uniref:YkgJ family cysteine cluster protein n=1 Tax=Methanolobus sp. WCC5 TaxID=3125785 RepID=UPI0032467127
MYETDFTPLKGLRFKCLEGCGFCCSFPAEVRIWERNFPVILGKNREAFRNWDEEHPWLNGIYTFRQHNDRGACIFLEDDKRCGIYDSRALLCRTFPVKFFFGWRLQLYPSMSCRGFSKDEGSDMIYLGKKAMGEIPPDRMDEMLERSGKMYESLPAKLGNYVPPQILQKMLLEYLDTMSYGSWDVNDPAIMEFEAELSSDNFIDLPVYLTEDLDWQLFKLENGYVKRLQMNSKGETKYIGRIVYSDLTMKKLSFEAIGAISAYLRLLVLTDHFIGVIYQKAIMQRDKRVQLADLALNELEKVRGIFLLKASLLAEFKGQELITKKIVADTIVLYDSYLATVPAFGMII